MARGIVPQLNMADRLVQRAALGEAERRFLDTLAVREVLVPRGRLIQRAGEPANDAFLLKSGWAMTFSDFSDGSRQVRRLHFPNDLLAMPSMAMRRHVENIEALTDCVVAPFAKERIAALFRDHPRLAATFFIFAQVERITYGDRLCALGRRSCKARIAFLIMDVVTRLRAIDPSITDRIEMHLTRGQMSEITGMTPVHASRMWNKLKAEGIIAAENGEVSILDERRLVALSGFVDRSLDMDFSWLPS